MPTSPPSTLTPPSHAPRTPTPAPPASRPADAPTSPVAPPSAPLARAPLAPRPRWLPTDDAIGAFYRRVSRYGFYRCRLTEYVARLLPGDGPLRVLDVGAGDGSMAALLARSRPHTAVCGVETFVRPLRWREVPLAAYDGRQLPFADRAFDVVLLSNVVHHAADQPRLVAEACRVARRRVIIKDHLCEHAGDRRRLALLDVLGNRRFGASTVGDYRSMAAWQALFATLPEWWPRAARALPFRTGVMAALFANELEVVFTLDRGGPMRDAAMGDRALRAGTFGGGPVR